MASRTLSIGQRLVIVIVATTAAVVAGLAWVFTARQLDDITGDLQSKARAYAQVGGRQLMSAVAFSDRETAREVLDALAQDGDIAALTLVGDGGAPLYAHGQPSADVAASSEPAMLARPGRIIVTTPVVSLEGPRGSFVLEVGTQRVDAARSRLIVTAVAVGAAALLLASLLAWLVVRTIASRLGRIATVATAVAGGDLDQPQVSDARPDEIGALALAFNTMLTRIRALIESQQEAARQEQARLAELVAARTAALDARNAEMRLVLEQVDQGLMIVDAHGAIASERSAAVERWLGPVPASGQLVDFVRAFAPAQAPWFDAGWNALLEDLLPRELLLAQLPAQFQAGERTLRWSYKSFDVDGASRLLVVMTDVTADLARERMERDDREVMAGVSRALRDPAGTLVSYHELAGLVAEIEAWSDPAQVWRIVHTLKGSSAMFGLTSVAEICHALESSPDDADARAAGRAALRSRWAWVEAHIGAHLDGITPRLDILAEDLDALERELARRAPHADLARRVRGWRHERVRAPLGRLAVQARALAARLGKVDTDVRVECDDELRVEPVWDGIWPILGHAVRNALDHGLEPAADRQAAGKPARGTLLLGAARDADWLTLVVEDDGRGIDWERVAVAARGRGLPAETRRDLELALFADGVSTATAVTDVSGRGVGMAAVLAACEAAGGHLDLDSTPGRGTSLRLRWPRAAFTRPLAVHTI